MHCEGVYRSWLHTPDDDLYKTSPPWQVAGRVIKAPFVYLCLRFPGSTFSPYVRAQSSTQLRAELDAAHSHQHALEQCCARMEVELGSTRTRLSVLQVCFKRVFTVLFFLLEIKA